MERDVDVYSNESDEIDNYFPTKKGRLDGGLFSIKLNQMEYGDETPFV